MKILNLILFCFVLFLTSSCSQVGSAITSTGEYVSKAGSLIAGKEKQQQDKSLGVNSQQPKKVKLDSIPPIVTALIKINTSKNSNLRSSGNPSRINITVLQLKSAGKFSNSRISSLKSDIATTLGTDFISEESISILPNSEKKIQFEIDSSARVIGVFGSFSQLNNTIWKASLNLPKKVIKKRYPINIFVDSKSISIIKN